MSLYLSLFNLIVFFLSIVLQDFFKEEYQYNFGFSPGVMASDYSRHWLELLAAVYFSAGQMENL